MERKKLVACILKCLIQCLEEDKLTADSRESLEVAIQCLESSYGVSASEAASEFNILEIYNTKFQHLHSTQEDKLKAEELKNEGNILMKANKFNDALDCYSRSIELNPCNAVYFCNRAAVYSKLGDNVQAINDCKSALSLDASYSKAYGRMGLAYSNLDKYKEAKDNYQKALELEPDNESLRNNLEIAEEKLKQQNNLEFNGSSISTRTSNVDLSSLLSNPTLMDLARHMLSEPSMQNVVSNLISGNTEGERMEALIQAGQNLAQQMQTANPGLIESLRRQMSGSSNSAEATKKEI